jgi:hypothetical protein
MSSTFADFLAAAEKGAASVYHAVLATGAEITSWESNPIVAPFLDVGVSAANDMLARAGVPATTSGVIESDIATALKGIAAADPTVPSTGAIGSLAVLAGTTAAAIDPNAAPLAAEAAGAVGVAETVTEGLAGA